MQNFLKTILLLFKKIKFFVKLYELIKNTPWFVSLQAFLVKKFKFIRFLKFFIKKCIMKIRGFCAKWYSIFRRDGYVSVFINIKNKFFK
jgi:hypothetical protein